MSHPALKREITQKTNRLILLKAHLAQNLPLAKQSVEEGYFSDAARQFEDLAIHAHHAFTIQQDLIQLSLDLERAESCQLEMSLPASR